MIKLKQEYLGKNLQSLYKRIVVIDETSSTNDLIKSSEYYKDRTLLLARNQSAGRGTSDRTFYCEKDKGIYASCVIDLEVIRHKSSFIPLVMACSIAQTLEFYGFKPRLKWVNDVLVDNKKVAGILCEKTSSDSRLIVGIGLNVYPIIFPDDIHLIATSLQNHSETPLNINDIAVHLFKVFDELLDQDSQYILALYKKYCQDLTKKVNIKRNDELVQARIIDVDEWGRLVVDSKYGELLVHSAEQIVRIKE